MVTVQDLKDREKEIANYLTQSQFEANKVWVEKVSAEGGQLSNLSEDNKVEISREVYKKGKEGYFAFLTLNPTSIFGQGRTSQLYERDIHMNEVEFVNTFAPNMNLSTIANLYGKMGSNLERTLSPFVFHGVTESDVPNLKGDLVTESKARYNVDIDGNKIGTLEDAVGIYLALRKNSGPEEFNASIRDYKA